MTKSTNVASPSSAVGQSSDFKSNVQAIREHLNTPSTNVLAATHVIYITLKPIDFLENIGDVLVTLDRQLRELKRIDAEWIFQVSPTDLMILSHQDEKNFLSLVTDVRMLLVRLVREHTPQAFFTVNQEQLISVYHAGRHRDELSELLVRLEQERPTMGSHRGARTLEVGDIERLLGHIDNMPPDQFMESFLTWQPVTLLRQDEMPRVLFREYYISMRALQDTFLQGINPFLNMTLFKMLTSELDKRILNLIYRQYIDPSRSSFNFNLETLLSSPFEQIGDKGFVRNMIVELPSQDIFSDFRRFQLAQQQARRYGARLAVDGVLPAMTNIMKCENIGCQVVKIQLDDELENVDNIALNLRKMMDSGIRIVATRVESLESIRQGTRVGIQRFQGFYVNKLLHSSEERKQFFLQ